MKKILAAKILTIGIVANFGIAFASGIPTVDVANITQSVITAQENIAQTLKQIEQYRTQLLQYENQIKNTLAPAAYIWDEAQKTIGSLQEKMAELNQYRNQIGDTDALLSKYMNTAYYKDSECFQAGGCADEFFQQRAEASEYQKKSSDSLTKSIEQQSDALQQDSRTLTKLQQQAQGADGQMQALQAANQLASAQASQFLQFRGIMLSQMQAANAQSQAAQSRLAQQDAAMAKARKPGGIDGSNSSLNIKY